MHPRSSHTRREQIVDDDSSSFNHHHHRTHSRTRGEQIDKERTDRWGFLFLLRIYLSSPASHIHRTSVFFTRLFVVCLFCCNLQFSRDGEVLGNNQQTVVTDCPCVGYPCSCDLDSMELLFPWRIRPQWQRRFQCKRLLSLSLSLCAVFFSETFSFLFLFLVCVFEVWFLCCFCCCCCVFYMSSVLQVTGLGRVDVAPTSGCRCCG